MNILVYLRIIWCWHFILTYRESESIKHSGSQDCKRIRHGRIWKTRNNSNGRWGDKQDRKITQLSIVFGRLLCCLLFLRWVLLRLHGCVHWIHTESEILVPLSKVSRFEKQLYLEDGWTWVSSTINTYIVIELKACWETTEILVRFGVRLFSVRFGLNRILLTVHLLRTYSVTSYLHCWHVAQISSPPRSGLHFRQRKTALWYQNLKWDLLTCHLHLIAENLL